MSEDETRSQEPADDGPGSDDSTESRASRDRQGSPSPVDAKRPGSDALRSAAQSAVAGAAVGGAGLGVGGAETPADATTTTRSGTEASVEGSPRLAAPATVDDEPANRLPVIMAAVLAAIVLLGAFALMRPGAGDGSGQAIDTDSRVSIADRDRAAGATTTTEATTTTTEATTTTAPTTTTSATAAPEDDPPSPGDPGGEDPAPNPPPPLPPPPTSSTTSSTSPPTPASLSVTYPRDSEGRMVLLEGGSSAISIYNAGGSPGNYAVGASGEVSLLSPSTGTVPPGGIVTVNVRAGAATDTPPPQGRITVAGPDGVIVTISVIIT